MTRGEEILAAIEAALGLLDRLRLEHYEDDDIRTVVETLGSKVERFFKTAIFPGTPGKDTFDSVINRLKSAGVARIVRDQLHGFRDLYNDAKHDPDQRMRLKNAVDAICDARAALGTLINAGLGATNAPVESVLSRFLWVSAYDDYVGGLTDVYVSLPLPDDVFATHLDVVYIKGTAWDALKSDLLATGSFYYGAQHFTPDIYARFHEGDFLNAGVWDGDYRQLIQLLSKYEDRATASRLLPDLRRDHMFLAALSAVALAGVDVVRRASGSVPAQELQAAILARADDTYAMPSERPWVTMAARDLAQIINELPADAWPLLSGPFWDLWNPKPLTTIVEPTESSNHYVIDDANRIVITLNDSQK